MSELESLWNEIEKKSAGKPTPTGEEILDEIQRYRREKRKNLTSNLRE
jgi:hypothetical protein